MQIQRQSIKTEEREDGKVSGWRLNYEIKKKKASSYSLLPILIHHPTLDT